MFGKPACHHESQARQSAGNQISSVTTNSQASLRHMAHGNLAGVTRLSHVPECTSRIFAIEDVAWQRGQRAFPQFIHQPGKHVAKKRDALFVELAAVNDEVSR